MIFTRIIAGEEPADDAVSAGDAAVEAGGDEDVGGGHG